MKLIGERGIEPPFWRTLRPTSHHRGDYSDSPAGKESEVKKAAQAPDMGCRV